MSSFLLRVINHAKRGLTREHKWRTDMQKTFAVNECFLFLVTPVHVFSRKPIFNAYHSRSVVGALFVCILVTLATALRVLE